MRLALALRALTRHPARSALGLLGVAVAGAMLLDMVMLGSGMRTSFRWMLEAQGYQLRLAPRGALPFDSDATIADADALAERLRARPEIALVSPILGQQLHTDRGTGAVTAFGLGVDPASQIDYDLLRGRHPAPDEAGVVANATFLSAAGLALGDTVSVGTGYDPQLRRFDGRRTVAVVGVGRFRYFAADQPAAALPIAVLRAMGGERTAGRASLILVRTAPGTDPAALKAAIEREEPRVSAITTAEALTLVEDRLRYFRQLAVILGTVSLIVAFLLVATLITVSVNERLGEIAVLRALGVPRGGVVAQVMLEGTALTLAGAVAGLGLGVLTARWLDAILGGFPGLPADFAFFVFRAPDAARALGLMAACGVAAGVYPAWRAASLPIAATLRSDAVA